MEGKMSVTRRNIPFAAVGRRTDGISSYLSAGVSLHAMTLVECLLLLATLYWIDVRPAKVGLVAALSVIFLFTQLDARSRYQEFKKIRDQLVRLGPDPRLFLSLSRSRCQRDAVLAAARQLGHGTACRRCFAAAGYRWYHLVPAAIRQTPWHVFSAAFLKATFFAPTYTASWPPSTVDAGRPCRRTARPETRRLTNPALTLRLSVGVPDCDRRAIYAERQAGG